MDMKPIINVKRKKLYKQIMMKHFTFCVCCFILWIKKKVFKCWNTWKFFWIKWRIRQTKSVMMKLHWATCNNSNRLQQQLHSMMNTNQIVQIFCHFSLLFVFSNQHMTWSHAWLGYLYYALPFIHWWVVEHKAHFHSLSSGDHEYAIQWNVIKNCDKYVAMLHKPFPFIYIVIYAMCRRVF